MDKPTKPSNLMPRSFGGVKNNWSASMQTNGYEDGVPAIYGGDNLNYQLDTTGKELDYCEKICDFINALPIGKGITTDTNNKLVYADYGTDITGKANISLDNLNANGKARIAVKEYLVTETYIQDDVVLAIIDNEVNLFKSLVNNNTGNSLSDDTKWEKVELGGASRNIGEIVASTIPLTDAGLHLLDGALLQYGSYQSFVDYIAGLYDSGSYSAIFTTEANWQSAVATYGVCSKFVYDSVNNTVRLPKYGNQIITKNSTISTALTVPVKGNGISLGLTNGSDYFSFARIANVGMAPTNKYGEPVGTASNQQTPTSGLTLGVTTDATKSGIIADTSNLLSITNYSLDCYYYIVIATTTKTDIQVDIDEIATDLNGKMDVDGTNAVNSVKFADGQWVEKNTALASAVTSPTTTDDTYSLASFLPNDGYSYEVLFASSLYTGSTSGNQNRVGIYTDIITTGVLVCGTQTRSSSAVATYGSAIVPVGVGRYVSVSAQSNNTGTYNLSARAYRRIGTNS